MRNPACQSVNVPQPSASRIIPEKSECRTRLSHLATSPRILSHKVCGLSSLTKRRMEKQNVLTHTVGCYSTVTQVLSGPVVDLRRRSRKMPCVSPAYRATPRPPGRPCLKVSKSKQVRDEAHRKHSWARDSKKRKKRRRGDPNTCYDIINFKYIKKDEAIQQILLSYLYKIIKIGKFKNIARDA